MFWNGERAKNLRWEEILRARAVVIAHMMDRLELAKSAKSNLKT